MAFSFTNSKERTYYLHKRDRTLKSGSIQTLYFFAREIKEGVPNQMPVDQIPDGYQVAESKNGLPVLKKA